MMKVSEGDTIVANPAFIAGYEDEREEKWLTATASL